MLSPHNDMVELYRQAFREHGRSEEALLWTKNKQSVRFEALCADISNKPGTLLDFGCGLGDLAIWLSERRSEIVYTGVDAVSDFIASNKKSLPQYSFIEVDDLSGTSDCYDHIVCSGVFNVDVVGNGEQHWGRVQESVAYLFQRVRCGLHIDFLAHDVDYRQDNSHHVEPAELIQFVEAKLSRRYTLNRTYMPYEYCISIFQDAEIERPRNIYNPLR